MAQGKEAGRSKSGGYFKELDKVTTSFFFTNFPDGASNTDLLRLFASFGYVGEVFVPRKVDKWGRRFGFVKYKEVVSVKDLEARLGDVWLWDMRLKVNLARFGREDKKVEAVQQKKTVGGSDARVVTGRSYKAATEKEKGGSTCLGEEEPCLEVQLSEVLLKMLEKAYCR